jgi:hypothetical protein
LGYIQEATIAILAEDSIAFDTPFVGRFGLSMLLEFKAIHTGIVIHIPGMGQDPAVSTIVTGH